MVYQEYSLSLAEKKESGLSRILMGLSRALMEPGLWFKVKPFLKMEWSLKLAILPLKSQ